MDLCDICGDLKSTGFIQKLDCGHEFHYECILKSFKSSKDYFNRCITVNTQSIKYKCKYLLGQKSQAMI